MNGAVLISFQSQSKLCFSGVFSMSAAIATVPRRSRPLPRRLYAAILGVGLTLVLTIAVIGPANAVEPVNLRTAETFAVLAGSTVTNTGPSVLNGDLGLHPGSAITGFTGPPQGTVNGEIHLADAVALQAKNDLTTAYNDAAGRTGANVATELGGETFVPGVYGNATLGLTGTVTLNGPGVYIFQSSSTLITAVDSRVSLTNGADACDVYWVVGSEATFLPGTDFAGTVMSEALIAAQDGATFAGRLLSRNGAVTLINNTITVPNCLPPTTTTTATETTTTTTTEPVPTTTTTTTEPVPTTTTTTTEPVPTTTTTTIGPKAPVGGQVSPMPVGGVQTGGGPGTGGNGVLLGGAFASILLLGGLAASRLYRAGESG
jgi:hypothetical protein